MRLGGLNLLIVACLWCIFTVQPSQAANHFQLSATFRASDSEPGDHFGTLVDLSGDDAVVRSRAWSGADVFLTQTHVFKQQQDGSWSERGILKTPSKYQRGGEIALWVGEEVAIEDGQIIAGKVLGKYSPPVFATWLEDLNHLSDQEWTWDYRDRPSFRPYLAAKEYRRDYVDFVTGRTVAISGRTAIVGDLDSGFECSTVRHCREGGVHVFQQDDQGVWDWSGLMLPDNPEISRRFGLSVALDGDLAAVTNVNTPQGSFLHIMESDVSGQWNEVARMQTEAIEKIYLASLVISNNTVVARSKVNGNAVVFTENQQGEWEESFSFLADQESPIFQGKTIALEDDLLALTAVNAIDNSSEVEIYRRVAYDQWELFDTITSPSPALADVFGSSLAFDNGRLMVGAASLLPAEETEPGAAYLFTLVPEPNAVTLLIASWLVWSTSFRSEQRASTAQSH